MDAPISTTPDKPKKGRRFGYAVSVVVNAVALYIANNLVRWDAQFITDQWTNVLTLVNISAIANIVIFAIFLCYDHRLFYLLCRTGLDVLGIVVMYRFYTIFPFDFNGFFEMGWLNTAFPYLLIIGMIGVGIGLVVRFVRFVTGKNIHY